MRAAAAAELETARKETVGYERKLLRASSEMEAWRRKANDLEAQMALAQAAAARAASEAVTSLKQAAIDTATAVADAEAARAEAARAEVARAEAAARAEDLAVTGAAAAPAAVLAAPAHTLDLLLAAARGGVRQDTRSIATAGTSATGAGAGLAWSAATSPCEAVGTSPCGTAVGTSPCGTAVGAHVPRAVCASPERPERPSLGRFLAAAGQPLATLVMSSLSDEDVAGICKREGRTPRRMREREVLRTAPPRSPNPGPSPGQGVGERLVERTPGRTPRPRRASPRAASGSGSPRS